MTVDIKRDALGTLNTGMYQDIPENIVEQNISLSKECLYVKDISHFPLLDCKVSIF